MADIKGITIEIDGDVTPLSKSLRDVNADLKSVQGTLRAVDKALKLDPKNVDLLQKKQEALSDAVRDVDEKLSKEREALAQLKAQDDGSEEMAKKQKELEREITATEATLTTYKSQLSETENTLNEVANESGEAEDASNELGEAVEDAGESAKGANEGWTASKQMLVDFAETAAKAAIQAVKELAGAMKDAAVDSAAYADDILTLSTQTHLSTDTLQEFQYMSQLVDVDLNTITGSLTKLTKNMASAQGGTGAAAEALKTLGVSATDSNGNLRSAEDVFNDVIGALGGVENEAERDALAMTLFGKSAQDLNPLIDAGSDAIAGFAEEAHEVGYVLDEEALGSLGAVDDSFQRMQTTMTATRNQIVAKMAPALASGGEQLLAFAQSVNWQKVGEIIGAVVSKIASYIPSIIATVKSVVSYMQSNVIPTVERVWTTVEPVMSKIGDLAAEVFPQMVEIIGAALEAISKAIDFAWPYIETVVTNTINNVRNVINIVMKLLQGDWRGAWDAIKKLVTDRIKQVQTTIKTVFTAIKTTATTIWNGIKTAIAGPIDAAKTAVSNAINNIKSYIASVSSSGIVTTFANIKSGVSDAISSAKSSVSSAIENIKGFLGNVSSSGIVATFNNIKNGISSAINSAKEAVSGAMEKIKSFLKGELTFPHIKVPHFKISGGVIPWGIGGQGTKPTVSVEWYRKAMNQAVLLNGATIFGAMGGSLMGGGEAGKEVILGLDKLKEYAGNRVINVNMTINASPNQDVNALARAVSQRIQSEVMAKRAVWT